MFDQNSTTIIFAHAGNRLESCTPDTLRMSSLPSDLEEIATSSRFWGVSFLIINKRHGLWSMSKRHIRLGNQSLNIGLAQRAKPTIRNISASASDAKIRFRTDARTENRKNRTVGSASVQFSPGILGLSVQFSVLWFWEPGLNFLYIFFLNFL